jgi:hypothetical protein
MSAWLCDARQAMSRPGGDRSSALIVVVLAIGIGAAIAMFSVLNAVVLRLLPCGDPQRLMWLLSIAPTGRRPRSRCRVRRHRERNTGVDAIGRFARGREPHRRRSAERLRACGRRECVRRPAGPCADRPRLRRGHEQTVDR